MPFQCSCGSWLMLELYRDHSRNHCRNHRYNVHAIRHLIRNWSVHCCDIPLEGNTAISCSTRQFDRVSWTCQLITTNKISTNSDLASLSLDDTGARMGSRNRSVSDRTSYPSDRYDDTAIIIPVMKSSYQSWTTVTAEWHYIYCVKLPIHQFSADLLGYDILSDLDTF